MGKVTGFIEFKRDKQPYRPVEERVHDWQQVMLPVAGRRAAQAGRALHGLRHPLLPPGLPARQPDPRLERPRLPGQAGARPSTACTPPTTSRSSPARLCPAPCEGSCVLGINDDPVTIKADRGRASSTAPSTRAGSRPSRPRCGPARRWRWSARARPASRPPSSSTAPATRSPSSSAPTGSAGCSATASPSSRWRSACWTGGSPRWKRRACASWSSAHVGVDRAGGGAAARSSTPSCSAAAPCAPRDLPIPGRELGGIHFAMDYLTLQNRRCEGDAVPDEAFITRPGQARGHHRRRRHRRRLPGHRAPPGRALRSTSSRSCRARPTSAPPTTRGRSGPTSSASPRPTRRAASACTPSRPPASRATSAAA